MKLILLGAPGAGKGQCKFPQVIFYVVPLQLVQN
jgi:hypothetical protein